jgi:hypothetical protein
MTPENLAKIRQSFTAATGMAVEDLLSAMGSQAGVLVKDIDTGGMFPVPELALFVEVLRPEVVETLMGQIAARAGMAVKSEPFGEIDIRYVITPLGEALSPAYAYSDGFFILAVNRTLLKSMLDTSEAGALLTHPHFKDLGDGMTAYNNSVFWVRVDGLAEKTGEVLDWTMGWMAVMQPARAENIQRIVSMAVDPLLDGLSMIRVVGGRTYTEEERIVSDVQLLMDRS